MEATPAPLILVVDDEQSVRQLLGMVLSEAGYGVAEASHGREAMGLIARGLRPNLVVTDLVMPEQEGIQTIRELRQRLPEARVIAISGAFGVQYLAMARLLGADGTLAKPFKPDSLLAEVRRVLAKPAARAAQTPQQ